MATRGLASRRRRMPRAIGQHLVEDFPVLTPARRRVSRRTPCRSLCVTGVARSRSGGVPATADVEINHGQHRVTTWSKFDTHCEGVMVEDLLEVRPTGWVGRVRKPICTDPRIGQPRRGFFPAYLCRHAAGCERVAVRHYPQRLHLRLQCLCRRRRDLPWVQLQHRARSGQSDTAPETPARATFCKTGLATTAKVETVSG